jgi:hypothetical protein
MRWNPIPTKLQGELFNLHRLIAPALPGAFFVGANFFVIDR